MNDPTSIPTRTGKRPLVAWLPAAALVVLAACPGDLPEGSADGGGGGGGDTAAYWDGGGGGGDTGGPADKGPPAEQSGSSDKGNKQDSKTPADLKKKPDKTPPPDKSFPPDKGGGKTGAKCPPACAAGYLCVNNKCRRKCKDGTDVCKAITVCSTSEVCMPVATGISVCMPATAPGGGCDNSFCGSKHVCASTDGKKYFCLPVCTKKGASCGKSGGKCAQALGSKCMFCTKV